jgi:hypothetical protein
MNYRDALEARQTLRMELPQDRFGAHLNQLGTGGYEVQLVDSEGNQENFDDILQVYLWLEDYAEQHSAPSPIPDECEYCQFKT